MSMSFRIPGLVVKVYRALHLVFPTDYSERAAIAAPFALRFSQLLEQDVNTTLQLTWRVEL